MYSDTVTVLRYQIQVTLNKIIFSIFINFAFDFHFKGVMKKNLLRWKGNTKDLKHRWNGTKKEQFSSLLMTCNAYMPTDIHRSIRKFDDLSYWKGSEFRTILLYIGIVALHPILNTEEYENFLMLSCACRIVYSSVYKNYFSIAKNMFDSYIHGCIRLYGEHTIGSNLHNLTHIIDDMNRSNVENIIELSTYKYENYLNVLGMKLKGFNKPLEQISRRILEVSSSHFNYSKHAFNSECVYTPILKYQLPFEQQNYSRITLKDNVVLTSRKVGDQWFMTHSGSVVKMKHATEINGVFSVYGYPLLQKKSFFTKPMDSVYLSIFQSDGKTATEPFQFNTDEISAKIMCLEFGSEFVYMPLLHTLDIFSN